MHSGAAEAPLFKPTCNTIRTHFHSTKDDHTIDLHLFDEGNEQVKLLHRTNWVNEVLHGFSWRKLYADGDVDWVFETFSD